MSRYDVIVVGARCAGSPTAMLLARKGYRVLVVDRAEFPSDTVSTHVIHAPGVSALRRWGLLDAVAATGCPPIPSYTIDFGPFALTGAPTTPEGRPEAYAPRRTVLDAVLVDAARSAGAEVRELFTVEEVLVEHDRVVGIRGRDADGTRSVEHAHVVVGADGRTSQVASAVGAQEYHRVPKLQLSYYTYWSGLPVSGFEIHVRDGCGWGAVPTNDGLTLVVVGRPFAEAQAYKSDIEGSYLAAFDLVPEFAERIRAARREERFAGAAVPGWFRKPFGPGWALVGDAGYNKDPITAQGISDAFRDAELLATALDDALDGRAPYDDALARYQEARDAHALPVYGFTNDMATLAPPSAEQAQLLAACAHDQRAMDDFMGVQAGSVSPADFFSPANIGRIMAGAS